MDGSFTVPWVKLVETVRSLSPRGEVKNLLKTAMVVANLGVLGGLEWRVLVFFWGVLGVILMYHI